MINLNLNINGAKKTLGFVSQYKTVYNEFVTKPSAEIAKAQNAMVKSIGSSLWARLDRFGIFNNHTNDNGEAVIDWVSPETKQVTLVNSPIYTQYIGFDGDGVAAYINNNFAPSSGVNFTLNSASLGIFIDSNNNNAGCLVGLDDGSKSTQIYVSDNNPTVFAKINDGTNLTANIGNGLQGVWILTRTGATARTLYRDKIPELTDSQVSDVLSSKSLYMLARNSATPNLFANQRVWGWFAGDGLSQEDVNVITDAVQTYKIFMDLL